MNYITSTDLRTKTPDLLNTLLLGEEIELIHKSKVVATIVPKKYEGKAFSKRDMETMIAATKKLKIPNLSESEREKNYRTHLVKKYGKGLS